MLFQQNGSHHNRKKFRKINEKKETKSFDSFHMHLYTIHTSYTSMIEFLKHLSRFMCISIECNIHFQENTEKCKTTENKRITKR